MNRNLAQTVAYGDLGLASSSSLYKLDESNSSGFASTAPAQQVIHQQPQQSSTSGGDPHAFQVTPQLRPSVHPPAHSLSQPPAWPTIPQQQQTSLISMQQLLIAASQAMQQQQQQPPSHTAAPKAHSQPAEQLVKQLSPASNIFHDAVRLFSLFQPFLHDSTPFRYQPRNLSVPSKRS